MTDPHEYVNRVIPETWLPKSLAEIKTWTWGELAQDRKTHWTGPDGKAFVMARQLLYIWLGVKPEYLADLDPDEQQNALFRQQASVAMFSLFPSESKEKKPEEKAKKSKSKTA